MLDPASGPPPKGDLAAVLLCMVSLWFICALYVPLVEDWTCVMRIFSGLKVSDLAGLFQSYMAVHGP